MKGVGSTLRVIGQVKMGFKLDRGECSRGQALKPRSKIIRSEGGRQAKKGPSVGGSYVILAEFK